MSEKMKNRDIEKLLMLYEKNHHLSQTETNEDCISDEQIGEYFCDYLNQDDRKLLEKHFVTCRRCIDKLIELYHSTKSADNDYKEYNVSGEIEEKIKDLVPGEDISDSRTDILFSDKVKCSNCGTKTTSSHIYCFHCGSSLKSPICCPSCSKSIREGDEYCGSCGKKILADKKKINEILEAFSEFFPEAIMKNKWLVAAIASILASFAFPAIFMQFLVAAGIFGGKWLLDPVNIKKIREIYYIWEKGDKSQAKKQIDELKKKIEKSRK